MATSSMVWCASMWRSPVACTVRSNNPCTAKASSMWSRKPIPVATLPRPRPSKSIVMTISVSRVRRSIVATRLDICASIIRANGAQRGDQSFGVRRSSGADAYAVSHARLVEVANKNTLALQCQLQLFGRTTEHSKQHEVRPARIRLQKPKRRQFVRDALPLGHQEPYFFAQPAHILKGGHGGQRRGDVDVVWLLDLPQVRQQPVGKHAIPHPQTRQTGQLAECAQDGQVVMSFDPLVA